MATDPVTGLGVTIGLFVSVPAGLSVFCESRCYLSLSTYRRSLLKVLSWLCCWLPVVYDRCLCAWSRLSGVENWKICFESLFVCWGLTSEQQHFSYIQTMNSELVLFRVWLSHFWSLDHTIVSCWHLLGKMADFHSQGFFVFDVCYCPLFVFYSAYW